MLAPLVCFNYHIRVVNASLDPCHVSYSGKNSFSGYPHRDRYLLTGPVLIHSRMPFTPDCPEITSQYFMICFQSTYQRLPLNYDCKRGRACPKQSITKKVTFPLDNHTVAASAVGHCGSRLECAELTDLQHELAMPFSPLMNQYSETSIQFQSSSGNPP